MKRFALFLSLPLFATVVAASAGGVAGAVGCTTHQCDSDCVSLGYGAASPPGLTCALFPASTGDFIQSGDANGGGPINTISWETRGSDDAWLDFPGQRQYFLYWPPEVSAFLANPNAIVNIEPYISTSEQVQGWNSIINCTGQLCEFGAVTSTSMEISNQSCAQYFLHVVVTATVPPAGAGQTTDAGTD